MSHTVCYVVVRDMQVQPTSSLALTLRKKYYVQFELQLFLVKLSIGNTCESQMLFVEILSNVAFILQRA